MRAFLARCHAAARPAALRWLSRRNALSLRRASFGADADACVSAVAAPATTPRRAAGDRVFAESWALARRDTLIACGALGVMANRQDLLDGVLGVLGRSPPTGGELER
jgi:hypothetical protein